MATGRILLVDFYNNFLRNWIVVPVRNDNGDHYGAVFGFLRSIKTAINLFGPSEVIITMDGPNSGLRRKVIYKEYKSNRNKGWKRGSIRAYDFLSENEQKSNFNFQVNRIKEYFSHLPVKTIMLPYVEADDIIAEICNEHRNKKDVIIYSSDADYFQLLEDRVFCFNPITKNLTGRAQFIDKHGYIPENYIFVKSVSGDKSDNISGVGGIGEKTFLKLFPEMVDTDLLSIQDIIKKCFVRSGLKNTKGMIKNYKKLIDSEEVLSRNYQLMQLSDVNVSLQSKDIISDVMLRSANKFNGIVFRKMIIEDKLNSQIRHLDDWYREFLKVSFRNNNA